MSEQTETPVVDECQFIVTSNDAGVSTPTDFLISPTNIAYRLHLNGGGMANFLLNGFGACWLNEIDVRFNLPEPNKGELGNSHFDSVTTLLRTLAANAVPCENMGSAELPAARLAEELLKIADSLDERYGADNIPIFPLTWVFTTEVDDFKFQPATLTLTPVLRESLAVGPAKLVSELKETLSQKW